MDTALFAALSVNGFDGLSSSELRHDLSLHRDDLKEK
jgi:hypothetical protein